MTRDRYPSLDAMRGIAVMGILLMNIVAFAMPSDAYYNPRVYGGTSPADLASWAVMSVLVDSKMRGLFSMLFGASMLLVYERAEASDGNGAKVHLRRMAWLLVFGLAHFFLLWWGDILALYAMCGVIGMAMLLADERGLKRSATLLIGANFLLTAIPAGAMTVWRWVASRPDADLSQALAYKESADGFSASFTPAEIALDLATHRGSYGAIVGEKLANDLFDPLTSLMMSGLETLGLMALGMLLLRNGFLTLGWESARYRRVMIRAYAVGIPPLILLAWWQWASGFDQIVTLGSFLAWSTLPRIAVMIGHAALAMLLIRRFADSGLMTRIEAGGKAAFTNYLGTSILMTTLFYGYGLGLYGHLSRWQAYLLVPLVWLLMLAWSKPWLDRFRYGPLEWAWRSLARLEWQKMRLE